MRGLTIRPVLCIFAAVLCAVAMMPAAAQYVLRPTVTSFEQPQFGTSILAQGNELFVGAPRGTGAGVWGSGYVSLYRRDGTGWQLSEQLVSGDIESRFFGNALALGGGWLAIAAEAMPDFGGFEFVYLFRRDLSGTWTLMQRISLRGPGGLIRRLAVSNTALAVSIPPGEGEYGTKTFIYDYVDGAWSDTPYQLSTPYVKGSFGDALALSETTLIVGDSHAQVGAGNNGAVSTFEHSANGWTHVSTLTMHLPSMYYFGKSIALCGDDRFAVSIVPYHSSPASTKTGSVVVYSRRATSWEADGEPLVAPSGIDGQDGFGVSLACDEDRLVIGDYRLKGAYFVDLNGARTLQSLQARDWPVRAGAPVAITGADAFVADPDQYSGMGVGAVYVFNNVIENIFADSFEWGIPTLRVRQ